MDKSKEGGLPDYAEATGQSQTNPSNQPYSQQAPGTYGCPQDDPRYGYDQAVPGPYGPQANVGYPYQQPHMMGTFSHQNNVTVVSQPNSMATIVVTRPHDYMGLAIFACLCCFWPLGLVAICKSYDSRAASDVNDFQRAQEFAQAARRYSHISIIVGIIICVIVFIVNIIVHSTSS